MRQAHVTAMMIIVLLVAAVLGIIFSLYMHRPKVLRGQGDDVVQIKTFHYPTSFVAQLKGDPHAGDKIYHSYCVSCHAAQPAIPLHAPKIGDKQAWAAAQKTDIKQLVKLTGRGFGAMPARGGCFECNDAQLQEAIEYILKQSRS